MQVAIPRTRPAAVAAALSAAILLSVATIQSGAAAPVYGYVLVEEYPHDEEAYTQGLIYENGFLYEGTGRYGQSSLRKVDLETGEILLRYDLLEEYFGEGITALRDTLYQITWQEGVGFAYVEADGFERIETFSYPWEGWGLTHDGVHLIASDGSSTIRFLDPRTRELQRQITVTDEGDPVSDLNELEYIQGFLYANIWYSERIAVIDPETGSVACYLDLTGLRELLQDPTANVLNGIAYDAQNNRLFVTGKWWPKLFEIDVPPLHASDATAPDSGRPGTGLLAVFPNPGFDRTDLLFALPAESGVSVRLHDVHGRPVRRVPSVRLPAGRHRLSVDLSDLSPGAYFLHWAAGKAQGSRKLLIVR